MTDRMQQLQTLLQRDPNDVFCLYGMAMEYAKLDDHAQAIQWFDRVIAADPSYLYAYFHKARSQDAAGDTAGAVQTLQVGLERAKAAGDGKAASEIAGLLDEYS
jgi:tetratricopeptide (TPR) repeat protein